MRPRALAAPAACDQFLLRVIHDLRPSLRQSFIHAELLEHASQGRMTPESVVHLRELLQADRLSDIFLTRLAEYCQAGTGLDRLPAMSAQILLQNAIRQGGEDASTEIVIWETPDCLVPVPVQKVFFELLVNARKFRQGPVSVQIVLTVGPSECIFEIGTAGSASRPTMPKRFGNRWSGCMESGSIPALDSASPSAAVS